MSKDQFVVIYRSFDAIEAEQLQDLLRQEGLPVRRFGNDAGLASLYAINTLAEFRLEVPESLAEQAMGLIDGYLADVTPDEVDELPWELRDEEQDGELSVSQGPDSGALNYPEE